MTTENSGSERRIEPRFEANLRCWLERESVTLLGVVTNLSRSGMFLRTPVLLGQGRSVRLTLKLNEGIVAMRGRVVWARNTPCTTSYSGLGIRFEEIVSGESLLNGFLASKTDEIP